MWLLSAHTALGLLGALAGIVLARAVTDLTPIVAVVVGGFAGWTLAAIVLGPAAERLDRMLHRMGGPRRRRR
jgi:hypothetical protein